MNLALFSIHDLLIDMLLKCGNLYYYFDFINNLFYNCYLPYENILNKSYLAMIQNIYNNRYFNKDTYDENLHNVSYTYTYSNKFNFRFHKF